jgi:hypothetical protein
VRLLYLWLQKWLHRSKRDFRGGGAWGASKTLLEGRDVWPLQIQSLKAEVLGRCRPLPPGSMWVYSERCVRPEWAKNGGCSVSDSSLVDAGRFVVRWMTISDATVRSYWQPLRRAQTQTQTGADFETAMKSVLCNVYSTCEVHQAEPYLFPRWRLLPFGRAIESRRCSWAWRRAKSALPGGKRAPAKLWCPAVNIEDVASYSGQSCGPESGASNK